MAQSRYWSLVDYFGSSSLNTQRTKNTPAATTTRVTTIPVGDRIFSTRSRIIPMCLYLSCWLVEWLQIAPSAAPYLTGCRMSVKSGPWPAGALPVARVMAAIKNPGRARVFMRLVSRPVQDQPREGVEMNENLIVRSAVGPYSEGAAGAWSFCPSPSGELPQPTTTSDIISTLTTQSNFFIRNLLIEYLKL